MYSIYTEHLSSTGSHFLAAVFLVHQTYRVSKIVYGLTKLKINIFSKYTLHISLNESHFFTAGFLATEYIRSVKLSMIVKSGYSVTTL